MQNLLGTGGRDVGSAHTACMSLRWDTHAYKHKGEIEKYVHALFSVLVDAVNPKTHDRDCKCPENVPIGTKWTLILLLTLIII